MSDTPAFSISDKNVWRAVVAQYEKPEIRRSVGQLLNTLPPFIALWILMYFSLEVSYFLTLLLAIPAAGFMVRIFIISHDCGHRSYFTSAKLNDFWGAVTSTLTLTPFKAWRHEHAMHHATSGNLDKRGVGDIWTLTVKEYLALPRLRRLQYRIYRHPFMLFVIGPLLVFVVLQRFSKPGASKIDRNSVRRTNLILCAILLLAHFTVGLKAFLLIQAPIIFLSSSAGVWMFYVQHQFEGTYWERSEQWDYLTQALDGSSFYKLPKVFQWFSGNIGFHHVHHLSARIPNYLLEKCHREMKLFENVTEITLLSSLRSLRFHLWDEENEQLISFSRLRRIRAAASA